MDEIRDVALLHCLLYIVHQVCVVVESLNKCLIQSGLVIINVMCDVTVTTTCDSTRVRVRQIAVVSNVDIELSRLLHIEIVNIYHNAGSS